jgi:Ser-tRNA(Ala) deacylase AlaX
MHFIKKDFPKEFIGKKLQNQINNKLSMYTNQKHTLLHLCRAAIPQMELAFLVIVSICLFQERLF